MANVKLIQGDCLDILRKGPEKSIHCCVTSPPYFGLRNYGCDGQIGLEETPEAYVAKLVSVFREVKRVLRDDGTLWLNLGDSYCSTAPGTKGDPIHQRGIFSGVSDRRAEASRKIRPETPVGLKPKDLIGIPWRVAFALQKDGWWLRQDIIWSKPNPMPESVTDRCTKAHEYIFLLSKSKTYYYDADAIAEESVDPESLRPEGRNPRGDDRFSQTHLNENRNGLARTREGFSKLAGKCYPKRNKRSVWTVTTKPYKEAHFATFPRDLISPCILAGCPVGGTVLDPFAGSGTTGVVAHSLGRSSVLIELNQKYCKLVRKQLGLFAP